jgi:hypothetical protein
VAQLDAAVVAARGSVGEETAPLEVEVNLLVTSPPTPRTQTPPPGWSGFGSLGAETKALPCWVRKAVLRLPRVPANELAADPAEVVTAPSCAENKPAAVVVHCAKAPELVETAMAKAKAAKTRPLTARGFKTFLMAIAPQSRKRVEIPILLLGHRTRRLRKARNAGNARKHGLELIFRPCVPWPQHPLRPPSQFDRERFAPALRAQQPEVVAVRSPEAIFVEQLQQNSSSLGYKDSSPGISGPWQFFVPGSGQG